MQVLCVEDFSETKAIQRLCRYAKDDCPREPTKEVGEYPFLPEARSSSGEELLASGIKVLVYSDTSVLEKVFDLKLDVLVLRHFPPNNTGLKF